ncbi:MAG TPA: hypothetical protein VE988_07850 [Gemmataceae bacterium]|nr:hypothetical protein [Gemmataceae bacterium]
MSTELTKSQAVDYEIPCQLLGATEFDMSEGLTPQQRPALAKGDLLRDEAVHGSGEVDLSTSRQQVPHGNAG